MTPAIKNWQSQPPAGGWGFTWTGPNGQKFECGGVTAKRVVEKLTDVLKMNRWFISDAHTWAIANGVWTARDPVRAIKAVTITELPAREDYIPVKTPIKHQHHWDTRPQNYGAQIWLWWNVFGMVFNKELWDRTIEHVRLILDPHRSASTGCGDCSREFARWCKEHDPALVTNEQEAAVWVFEFHNSVNIRAGKPPMTWKMAAKRFAWKVAL